MLVDIVFLFAAYLLGAVPFGYLLGRLRGIDLFKAGSGNIGATNAGRVLGWKLGILVFALDFLKGAAPVAAIVPLAGSLDSRAATAFGSPETLRVLAAALAFLGHLFPIYLGFRGGKGVATGAGTIFILVPGPAALAVLAWIAVVLAARIVSLASLAAVTILVAAWLLISPAPFAADLPITIYLLAGSFMVIGKHRANIRRLIAGAENPIGDFPMRDTLLRVFHVVALGLWFGGAAFFNFVAAPLIFQSFDTVAKSGPSDRTAHYDITKGMSAADQERLGKALAGAAVGPIFPPYYLMQTTCCAVALATALTWWKRPGAVHRRRVLLLTATLLLVTISVPISEHVSSLRVLRFDVDKSVSEQARAAFAAWHLVSLLLSLATTTLAGIALAMAARLPERAV